MLTIAMTRTVCVDVHEINCLNLQLYLEFKEGLLISQKWESKAL